MHPYNSIDTATALKKSHFILSEIRFFHMMDNLSIAVHVFTVHMLTSFSVDIMHSATDASIWVIKLSYLSFGVRLSDVSLIVTNLFLTLTVY